MNNTLILQSDHFPALDNIGAYRRYVQSLPILSAEEEHQLARQLNDGLSLDPKSMHIMDRETGPGNEPGWEQKFKKNKQTAMAAAQKLIMSQLRLVVKIADNYRGYGLSEQDLIQEGNIGLMKAVKNFDPMRKIRLYSYALVWIKAEIQAYVLQNCKMVKLASTKSMKKLFFGLRSSQHKLMLLGVPKGEMPKIIAKEMGVLEEEVREAQSYFSDEMVSLSENEDEHAIVYEIPSPDLVENIVEKKHDSMIMNKKLTLGWNQLLPREKDVLKKRFFMDDKITHKDMAKQMGISGERVRQIEVQALEKLKKYIEPVLM